MASIGEQIRQARKLKGLTQEALASQLNLTRQAVSHWESGRTMPDAETLLKLSGLLGRRFESGEAMPEAPVSEAASAPAEAVPAFASVSAALEPSTHETDAPDPLQRERRKNHILRAVLISVVLLVCLVSLGFFLNYQKASDIRMKILEPEVFLHEKTQLLGDLPGWEFTLCVENHSDVPFTPDLITVLLYRDNTIIEKGFVGYTEMLPWMDSEKLRKGESPLHWLFSTPESDVTHAVLIMNGRDDNGHVQTQQLTLPLQHTYN